ncbi:MAG: hypothetical protein JSV03_00740, partial [Planctomycetota bacterium]
FQLIIATIFLTAIIWIYADQTSHKSYQTFVAVRIAASSDIAPRIEGASADSPNLIHVPVTMRGAKAAIRRLQLQESTGDHPFELAIKIAGNIKSGDIQSRDITPQITHLDAIRDLGLHVDEVHRPTIEFTVDRYKTVELDVHVDPGVYTIKGEALIQPPKVTAYILESDYDLLNIGERRLDIDIESYLSSDQLRLEREVSLGSKWQGVEVTFKPARVKIMVQLEQKRIPKEITVLLWINVKPDFFQEYEYVIEDESARFQKIDISVPKEKADQLTKDMIDAYVKIEDDDLPTTKDPVKRDYKVEFKFPKGFEDVEIISQERMVTLILKRKAGSEKPTPAPAVR